MKDETTEAARIDAEQEDGTPAAMPNPLAAIAPPLARMTKADKRNAALNALAALAGLVDLAPDENAMRKIARDEADRIRPVRLTVASPVGIRDLGSQILHPSFPAVLQAVSARVNPLIFGAAGSGKTTIAAQIADALGLTFHFTGAVLKSHQLLGYIDARGALVRTAFRDAFEHGGVFLFDEIDASAPNALLTVNAALSNGFCDFPDGRIKAHADFRFIAAANTRGNGASREYCGRNQLDGATIDRFGAVFEIETDSALTARIVSAFDFTDPEHRRAALEWVKRVDDYREAAQDLGLRGIISPRAAINGARLIAAGADSFRNLDTVCILARFDSADDRKRLADAAKKRIAERQVRERAQETNASEISRPA